ncbi:hypothetical protein K438DRAFT_1945122 [Mycena galopus ATCC 62051]|nr:hypothetical protein K438DRAFT_1945122 [Mycena galopus ATCC 62051]
MLQSMTECWILNSTGTQTNMLTGDAAEKRNHGRISGRKRSRAAIAWTMAGLVVKTIVQEDSGTSAGIAVKTNCGMIGRGGGAEGAAFKSRYVFIFRLRQTASDSRALQNRRQWRKASENAERRCRGSSQSGGAMTRPAGGCAQGRWTAYCPLGALETTGAGGRNTNTYFQHSGRLHTNPRLSVVQPVGEAKGEKVGTWS